MIPSHPATGSYIVPQIIKSAFGSFDISITPNSLDKEKIVLELQRDESDIQTLSLKNQHLMFLESSIVHLPWKILEIN